MSFQTRGMVSLLLLAAAASAVRVSPRKASSALVAEPEKKPYHQEMENYQNAQYFGNFMVGGQPIKGIFDTGSFELVVFSTKCKMCDRTWKTAGDPYDAKKSETFVNNGTVSQVVYGSGPLLSVQGYDTVDVGPLKAQNQSFWEVTEHKIPVMNSAKFSAIVGIGPKLEAAEHEEKTLLMSYGVEEFSICLERASGAPGWMTWGPVATKEEVKTNFVAAPVIGKHHWGVKMTTIRTARTSADNHLSQGGAPQICPAPQGCAAIVDSGTSLIAAPTQYLQMLSQVIPAVAEDCSNLHDLPTLLFELGEHTFRLPPRAYVMKIEGDMLEAKSIWDVLFFKPKVYHQKLCIPAFMQLDMMSAEGPVWILGMPFFRYYYTSFDRRKQELRFAEASRKCEWQPYKDPLEKEGNKTSTNFLSIKAEYNSLAVDDLDYEPETVNINAIVPPTLSSVLDTTKKDMIL